MAPAQKTDVSINGDRTTLHFGRRYRVRYGKDATVIEGTLDSRANNGDLVFLVDPTEVDGIPVTKRRVRPSTVDAILPSDVPATTPVVLVESDETPKAPKLTKAGRARLVEAGADPEAVAAATSAEDVDGVMVGRSGKPYFVAPADRAEPKTGKAYADRNQVWKCGTCKRRTRRPECVGTTAEPHPAVSAPVGKRLADRLGDQ